MEFFEAIKTFIIATRAEASGFREIAGTKLSDEFFAYKEEGRTLHPEARWIISDIKSGLGIPNKEKKGALLRFATLKDCKDWVANIPEEYQQKIAEAKADPKYAEACQRLEDFKNSKVETESLDFDVVFEELNKIYEDINQVELEWN